MVTIPNRDDRGTVPRRGQRAGVNGQDPPGDEPDPDAAELAALAANYTPVDWREAWAAQPAEVPWLLEPVLAAGTVNVMYGGPAVGKSLITLLEIARRLLDACRTVVYVDLENGPAEMTDRLMAAGASPGELDQLVMYCWPALPALDTREGGRHLLALAVTAGADLVIIDTTSRVISGRENDADTFLQLSRYSLVPLRRRGIAVLRLDHPGKDNSRGQRGSSAKDGDPDTVWRLSGHAATVLRLEREEVPQRPGRGGAAGGGAAPPARRPAVRLAPPRPNRGVRYVCPHPAYPEYPQCPDSDWPPGCPQDPRRRRPARVKRPGRSRIAAPQELPRAGRGQRGQRTGRQLPPPTHVGVGAAGRPRPGGRHQRLSRTARGQSGTGRRPSKAGQGRPPLAPPTPLPVLGAEI